MQKVVQFWKEIQKSKKVIEYNEEERKLWFECWTAVADGHPNFNPPGLLLSALLKMPAIKVILPPLPVVIEVMRQVALFVSRQSLLKLDDFTALQSIVNTISDRIGDHAVGAAGNTEILVAKLAEIRDLYDETMMRFLGDRKYNLDDKRAFRTALGRTADIENFMVKVQNIQTHDVDAHEEAGADDDKPWMDWITNPRVGWLMSGSWQDIPELLSTYNDADEYAETLLRIWTSLTFYWGAGAVWPRCCHSQGGKGQDQDSACATPLMTRATGSGFQCSSKIHGERCPNMADWKCFRYAHDAICSRCLRLKQDSIAGAPSTRSSTDIYDGLVWRETNRREGTVFFVSSLESRKPPKIAPNWKTSYRLPVSGLVAIARLDCQREPLARIMKLQWAEVVNHDPRSKVPEWQERQSG